MGGFMGYVNFGTAGFFAVGAYSSVVLYNLVKAPLLLMIPFAGVVCGLLGLGMGYLTLRLRGVYFAIATLALAIVLETLVVNLDYVGGATGAYILRAREIEPFGDYIEFLFFVMLLLAIFAVAVARWIERSKTGRGFAAIRDDEIAGRMRRRTDFAAQADRDDGFRISDGGGRVTVRALRGLHRAFLGIQSRLCGQLHCDADDWRNDHLAWPSHWCVADRHRPAGRDGDDFVGAQPPDRRRPARVLRDRGSRGNRRAAQKVAEVGR